METIMGASMSGGNWGVWACGREYHLLFPFCSPLLSPVLSQETPGQSLQTTAPKKDAVRCGVHQRPAYHGLGHGARHGRHRTVAAQAQAEAQHKHRRSQSSKWRRASAKLICTRERHSGARKSSRGAFITHLHEQQQRRRRPIRQSTQQPESRVSLSLLQRADAAVEKPDIDRDRQTLTDSGRSGRDREVVKKSLQRCPRQARTRSRSTLHPPSSFFSP